MTTVAGSTLFQAVYDEVVTITNRGDLTTEIINSVRLATMKFHAADEWKRDLRSLVIPWPDTNVFRVTLRRDIELASVQRLRKIKHIREYIDPQTYLIPGYVDPSNPGWQFANPFDYTAPGAEITFKKVEPDDIFDRFHLRSTEIWYQVGEDIYLVSSRFLTQLEIYYYQYPNLIPGSYDSWIARDMGTIIAQEAAGQVFKMIGKDEESQTYKASFEQNLALLRISEI